MTQIIKLYLKRGLLKSHRKEFTSFFRKNQTTLFFWIWLCKDKCFGSATAMKVAIFQKRNKNKKQPREECKLREWACKQQAIKREQAIIWVKINRRCMNIYFGWRVFNTEPKSILCLSLIEQIFNPLLFWLSPPK